MKKILITGCSSGIGLAVAQHLHSAGYSVVASARKIHDVEHLRSLGIPAVLLDMRKPESIEQGLSDALAISGGSFYAVFHNAGYGQSGALEDLPTQALREQFEVNVFGAHAINVRLIPLMRKNGGGRIIWNSSILGFFAMKYRGAYNASKFAIEGLADTLRLELIGSGIHVSLLEPGPIATLFRKNSQAAFLSHIRPDVSVHSNAYKTFLDRLGMPGNTSRFTLPPQACIPPLMHALESKSPKHRYRVTTPTKIVAVLKRLFPSTILDKIALRGF
jgi:NAD(P)-dependent dehydrogenase (short-subunit alcohol dehydrogenase family)